MAWLYSKMAMAFFIALAVSFAMTPVAIKLAPKIGAMDVPKDGRRMHRDAMPRFGGMAIYLGSVISMLLIVGTSSRVLTILTGGTLMYALGVFDDLKGLRPGTKFFSQVIIAGLMYFGDIRVNFMRNLFAPGKSELSDIICFIVTILWIVGITNTVNLIDGLDGLASGTTAIASLCIAYVAYIHGMYLPTFTLLALAGGTLGFLPFNFYPSKIFMGDGGSLFLGFMLSTLSVMGLVKSATLIAVIIPVLVLGFPIFDTAFAIFRRVINRRPIMQADKQHLHHRLIALGYGQRRATLMLYCVSGIMGIASVTVSRGLYLETLGLFSIAALMIYIFLTDANHIRPQIRNPEAPPISKLDLPVTAAIEPQNDEPSVSDTKVQG